MNLILGTVFLFCALVCFSRKDFFEKNESDAYTVKSETVQISPRPYSDSDRDAIIIRKIDMKDGSWRIENWAPFINEKGKPDIKLIFEHRGRYDNN